MDFPQLKSIFTFFEIYTPKVINRTLDICYFNLISNAQIVNYSNGSIQSANFGIWAAAFTSNSAFAQNYGYEKNYSYNNSDRLISYSNSYSTYPTQDKKYECRTGPLEGFYTSSVEFCKNVKFDKDDRKD